ncbi:Two-component system response regulator [Frankia canadensis]|uniref:Two-component system response regulator n=1 Tax=Frankia canadensis TaxID=1836972 RepID=A0A2I2KLG3_9ACTN|nr:response regulator transcription factor [Frankia canadensis]SNQ46486.1 Two-component system response regulator [Frankia canadensis]SOU53776.1 Two-component system response regulator [Frankia canadensis]
MTRILVAERDPAEASRVQESFSRQGFEIVAASSGTAAAHLARSADLLVLALDLPDLDGLEVCRRIRRASAVPVIGTAAPHAGIDNVVAFRSGLDAYLLRPCSLRELVARAQAILRRTQGRAPVVPPISAGPVHIHTQARELYVHGRPVRLTRKEFDLLALLAAQPEMLFSRRHIMAAVWGDESAQSSRTLDTHVSSVRTKVGDASVIRTVRGIGFRIGYRDGDLAATDVPGQSLGISLT